MKYLEFIKEQQQETEYNNVKELISNFLKKDINFYRSFESGKYYMRDNYKKDLDEFYEYMNENGVLFDSFINKHYSKVFADDFFISSCGVMDTLLYQYNKKHPLSGCILKEKETYVDHICEIQFKYYYDYHRHDLGIKYLLQSYQSLEDFYFACAEHLCHDLFLSDTSVLSYDKDWQDITKSFFNYKKHYLLFSKSEKLKNGSIGFIDLNVLFDLVLIDEKDKNEAIRIIKETTKPKIITDNLCIFYFGDKDISMEEIIDQIDTKELKNEIEVNYYANRYNL